MENIFDYSNLKEETHTFNYALDLARNPEDAFRAPLNTTNPAPVTDLKTTTIIITFKLLFLWYMILVKCIVREVPSCHIVQPRENGRKVCMQGYCLNIHTSKKSPKGYTKN